jgi:hypothetical protein
VSASRQEAGQKNKESHLEPAAGLVLGKYVSHSGC